MKIGGYMKICKNCNFVFTDGLSCPKCGSNDIIEEQKNEIDLTFRVEKIRELPESLKNDLKGIKVLNIIAIICILLFGVSFVVPQVFILTNLDNVETSDILFALPFIIAGSLVIIFGIIAMIALHRIKVKTKYLSKSNSILLKNIPFVVLRDGPILKVRIDYTDEFGNVHVFKGILPKNLVQEKGVCDVLVDQENYSKYLIRYEI